MTGAKRRSHTNSRADCGAARRDGRRQCAATGRQPLSDTGGITRRRVVSGSQPGTLVLQYVQANYFATLSIPLLLGRGSSRKSVRPSDR